MSKAKRKWDAATPGQQSGFTLLETLVSLIILLAVSGIVMTGMMQLMQTQGTIANRTEMHTSVRSATELLQQEIGQAGMVSLPVNPATGLTIPLYMSTPVFVPVPDVPWTPPAGVFLSSAAGIPTTNGIFNGEQLVVDTGDNQETITVVCGNPCSNPIGATFNYKPRYRAGRICYGDRATYGREWLYWHGPEALRRHQRRRQYALRRIYL